MPPTAQAEVCKSGQQRAGESRSVRSISPALLPGGRFARLSRGVVRLAPGPRAPSAQPPQAVALRPSCRRKAVAPARAHDLGDDCPGRGVLLRTHQTLNSRSYDRLRLSHSRSVLALAIRPSRVASLARTHAMLIPRSVPVGCVACGGMEADHAVRLTSVALLAATERAAIWRALAELKRAIGHNRPWCCLRQFLACALGDQSRGFSKNQGSLKTAVTPGA
jgi:hypothetical protein